MMRNRAELNAVRKKCGMLARHLLVFRRTTFAFIMVAFALSSLGNTDASSGSANPYRCISERNLFGLRSTPPVHFESPTEPLPKVTLTGITTVLKGKRALLKVQFPPKPLVPTKEQSYLLTEGQRDGPIEVLEINEKTPSVKLNNSGTVMIVTFSTNNLAPATESAALRAFRPRLSTGVQAVAR
jgi:hypothetical protein